MPVAQSLKHSALNQELAVAMQSQMPVRESPGLRDAVNFDESRISPVHRWFRYREGFSPAILDKLSGHQRVFDPFCGCGTTLIEAKRRGISAVGTDVNPLAVFIAKVKTRNYSAKHRIEFEAWAQRALESRSIWPEPKMPLLPKLFQPEALNELLKLRAGLEACADKKVRDLLLLCWLNILESCSNVFKEGNGLKYRNKKRQPGKYATVPDAIWIPRYFGQSIRTFVRNRWRDQCLSVGGDLEQLAQKGKSEIEILERSCLDAAISDELPTCDASVFSPPYANRFDYFEAFKIELWMGNFVTSPEQMRELRKRSMRNNLTVQSGEVKERSDLEALLDLMDDKASSVQMGIRETLRGYFDDVSLLAKTLRAVLSPGGKVLCVVGNSAYAGILVPTDLLCGVIFEEAGFTVESIEVARHLHVSSQQRGKMVPGLQPYMRESVITCRR
jgi:SAM-dependent methyltransferase